MSRNQLSVNAAAKFDASPMFTVDSNGGIQPTATQTVVRSGSLLIQSADPTAPSQYTGYVCAWLSGCKCATIIADLGGFPHMKIRSTQYTISSTAPVGNNYTIYATSGSGGGPSAMSGTGDIHIGS